MKYKGYKIHIQQSESGWRYGYRAYQSAARAYRKHWLAESHGNEDGSIFWLGRCNDKKTAIKKVRKTLAHLDNLSRAEKAGTIRNVETYLTGKHGTEQGNQKYARYLLFNLFRRC